jgi:uncharacterized membrane protein YdjX (TVP38/TMEM64 family)
VLAALAVLITLARALDLGAYLAAAQGWVERLGPLAPFAFILGYALLAAAGAPGAVLTLAAGILFGLVEGTLYTVVGAIAGSTLAFLIARYAFRGWVEQRIARSERFRTLDRMLRGEGLKIVFLLRLSPIFPFNFLNYALGVTNVRLRDYVLGGFGMLPGTVLYVYYGTVLGSLAKLAGGAEVERGRGYYAVLALGLVAALAVTALITRMARRAFKQAAEEKGVADEIAGEVRDDA